MTLIAESGALAAFCQRQRGVEFVAIDTEFMRDKTYWPKLCLVQIAGPEEAAAIDTLAPGLDWTEFFSAASLGAQTELRPPMHKGSLRLARCGSGENRPALSGFLEGEAGLRRDRQDLRRALRL